MKRDQTTNAEGRQLVFKKRPGFLAFGPGRDPGRLGSFVLALAASLLGLAVAEGVSRVTIPVSPGARFVTSTGESLNLTSRGSLTLPPNTAIWQIADEYDAKATITGDGYRAPNGGSNPEIVFLGDSFTFGVGLNDGQTFVALYCKQRVLTCANLGRPATGTVMQLAVLDYYLREMGWRPRVVKLFIFATTSSLMPGNDLLDNLRESHHPAAEEKLASERIVGLSGVLLRSSNLARVLYFYYGPVVRAAFSPRPLGARLREALKITGGQLAQFQRLAAQHPFRAQIYVIHPVQDLINGTGAATTTAIRGIAGALPVFDTADAMPGNPRQYYFSYDQHLNAKGAAAIARFLLAQDHEGGPVGDAPAEDASLAARLRRSKVCYSRSMGDA